MASNTRTIPDEDGSFEDWIEIQNNSPASVNLSDWSLTDNPDNLTKWRFPATNLPPGRFLLTIAGNHVRLEWRPAWKHSGGTVVREATAS